MSDEDSPPSKKLKAEGEENINSDDKYNNFVTQEELEKLREFKVLDEVKATEEDSEDDDSDGQSQDLPDEEIEKMLDENLPSDFKVPAAPKEKPYVRHTKIVLEEKGVNPFEILPLDWMMVRHYSGMPIYIHKTSRVCTLSKPYFLGKGNSRRHDIPISAIPCLLYRRALEEEAKQKEIDRKIEEQIKNGTWKQTEKGKSCAGKGVKKTTENSVKNNLEVGVTPSTSTEVEQNGTKGEEQINNGTWKKNEKGKSCAGKGVKKSAENNVETNLDYSVTASTSTQINTNNLHFDDNKSIKENNLERSSEYNATDLTEQTSHTVQFNDIDIQQQNKLNKIDVNGDSVDGENNIDNTDNSEENKVITRCPYSRFNEADKDEDFTQDVTIEDASNRDNDKENIKTEDFSDLPLNAQPVVLPGGIVMAPPRVESPSTSWKTQHLTPEQVTEYCKALFKFKTVSIMHFERWADRRKYTKARKALQCPTLPEGTKLITIPAKNNGQENGGRRRDWVMNMNGRSYLSVFHEYVRRALQEQPQYKFQQLENASSPYEATVFIGEMQYGVGRGSSKRQAKAAAARASIQILIPEMREHLDTPATEDTDFTFFDYVAIEDPRIPEFCASACEPSPHAILRTCLLRNFGACDPHIHTEIKKLEQEQIELTMKVGKHSAIVVCKNKKTAKQRAAQAILQALHPQVQSWGSLLRLYGSRSVKSSKQRKQEEQQITLLQEQARHNRPNRAVLEKLRADMRALAARDEARAPRATLMLPPPPARPALHLDL